MDRFSVIPNKFCLTELCSQTCQQFHAKPSVKHAIYGNPELESSYCCLEYHYWMAPQRHTLPRSWNRTLSHIYEFIKNGANWRPCHSACRRLVEGTTFQAIFTCFQVEGGYSVIIIFAIKYTLQIWTHLK